MSKMSKDEYIAHSRMIGAMRRAGTLYTTPEIHTNKSTIRHHQEFGDNPRTKDFLKQMEFEKPLEMEALEKARWLHKDKLEEIDRQRQRDTEEDARKINLERAEHYAKFQNTVGYVNGRAIPQKMILDPNSRHYILPNKGRRFDFFKYSNATPEEPERELNHAGTMKTQLYTQLTEGKIQNDKNKYFDRETAQKALVEKHRNKDGKVEIYDHLTHRTVLADPESVKVKTDPDGRGVYLVTESQPINRFIGSKPFAHHTIGQGLGREVPVTDADSYLHDISRKVDSTTNGHSTSGDIKRIHGDRYQPLHSMNNDRPANIEDHIEAHDLADRKFRWSHGKKVYE
ncbi:MAG: hypothetical protein OPY03_04950 [Nitrosopumilus sp.]|nr:hypothetical protein [Nitrosopumilus sp.]